MKGKLRYGDTVIPYTIIQTKRKKTMQIFVEKKLVEVRAPNSKNIDEIKKILKEKTSWIFNTQLKLKENQNNQSNKRDTLFYLGKLIPISTKTLAKKEYVSMKKNRIYFHTRSKLISQNKIKKMHEDWLISKFTPYIEKKISQYSKMLKVEPKGLVIKNLKSKWGSVTINQKIHLNVNLLKAPKKIIDYVVLHELAHLKIKGHRQEFWRYLKSYMSDYAEKKKWLEKNSSNLLVRS